MRRAGWLLCVLIAVGCSSGGKDAGKGGGEPTKDLAVEIDPDALPSFAVEKGKSARHKIKVLRQGYQGGLALEFDVPADSGLKLEAAAMPAGRDEVEITVTAAPDAAGGKVGIKVSAPDHKAKMLVAPEIRPE